VRFSDLCPEARDALVTSPDIFIYMPSWLAEAVQREGGKIRFDRFMQLALFDPIHGYYSVQMHTIGDRGDFSTAATLDDSLGRAVARWIRAEAKALRLPNLTIIEIGPGTGRLARTILRRFRPWENVHYCIVDVVTRNRLSHRIKQFRSVREALTAAGGVAILFSNELVDAFPCRRFVRTESGWDEIWIELQHGRWLERTVPAQTYPESSVSSPTFAIGQGVEIHESYHSWLKELSSSLQTGALLTIDYGGSAVENYRGKRSGTLRAFFQHQRLEGIEIYRRPGSQDLTADVNFDDLRGWGHALGFDEIAYVTQRDFIERWYPEALQRDNAATRFVLDPAGAGTAFKVLHQRRAARASAEANSHNR
jgi:SAM-dependent MidA family methyltransferase